MIEYLGWAATAVFVSSYFCTLRHTGGLILDDVRDEVRRPPRGAVVIAQSPQLARAEVQVGQSGDEACANGTT